MSEEYVRHSNGNVGQVDGMRSPRYAGFPTFARLPRREDVPDFDIAVLGVPFDAGVTYRPGARFGPSAIRAASRLLRPYNPAQDVSPFEVAQVVDAGDVVANPFDITEGLEAISAAATELIGPGRPLVALGGDHTISLPLLRALHTAYGPIALVHFDAHLDTWDTYFGAPCTHGTPFRRASEEGLVAKGTRPTSASAGRSTTGVTCSTTPSSGSPASTPVTWTASGWRARWSGSRPGSVTSRCTSRSTSTSSTRPSRPARARPRPGG